MLGGSQHRRWTSLAREGSPIIALALFLAGRAGAQPAVSRGTSDGPYALSYVASLDVHVPDVTNHRLTEAAAAIHAAGLVSKTEPPLGEDVRMSCLRVLRQS